MIQMQTRKGKLEKNMREDPKRVWFHCSSPRKNETGVKRFPEGCGGVWRGVQTVQLYKAALYVHGVYDAYGVVVPPP